MLRHTIIIQSHYPRDGDGVDGVDRAMFPQQRHKHIHARRFDLEISSFHCASHVRRPEIIPLGSSNPHAPSGEGARRVEDLRIIAVDNQYARISDSLDQARVLAPHAIQIAKSLKMLGRAIGNHANIRQRNIRQQLNFPRMIRAHLQHQIIRIRISRENRQRHTNVVVKTLRRHRSAQIMAQCRVNQMLHPCFSVAPRDGNHFSAHLLTGSSAKFAGIFRGCRSIIAARAPPAAACARKVCPSKFSPCSAINSDSVVIRRVSVQTAEMRSSAASGTLSAPVTRRISASEIGFMIHESPTGDCGAHPWPLPHHRNDAGPDPQSDNFHAPCQQAKPRRPSWHLQEFL